MGLTLRRSARMVASGAAGSFLALACGQWTATAWLFCAQVGFIFVAFALSSWAPELVDGVIGSVAFTVVLWGAQRATDVTEFAGTPLWASALSSFVGIAHGVLLTALSYTTVLPTSASDKALKRLASAAEIAAKAIEGAYECVLSTSEARHDCAAVDVDNSTLRVFSKLERCREAAQVARSERLVAMLPRALRRERVWRFALPPPLEPQSESPLPSLVLEASQALRCCWRTASVITSALSDADEYVSPQIRAVYNQWYRSPTTGAPLLESLRCSVPAAMHEAHRACLVLRRRRDASRDGPNAAMDAMRVHLDTAGEALDGILVYQNEVQRISDNLAHAHARRLIRDRRRNANAAAAGCGEHASTDDGYDGESDEQATDAAGDIIGTDDAELDFWPPPAGLVTAPDDAQSQTVPDPQKVLCETFVDAMSNTRSTWEHYRRQLRFRLLLVLTRTLCDDLGALRRTLSSLLAWDADPVGFVSSVPAAKNTATPLPGQAPRPPGGTGGPDSSAFAIGGYAAARASPAFGSLRVRAMRSSLLRSAETDASALLSSSSFGGDNADTPAEGAWKAWLQRPGLHIKQLLAGAASPACVTHLTHGLRPALAAVPLTAIGFWALSDASATTYQAGLWSMITVAVLAQAQALGPLLIKSFERLTGTVSVGFLSYAIALWTSSAWFVVSNVVVISVSMALGRILDARYSGVVAAFTHTVIAFSARTFTDDSLILLVVARIAGVSAGIIASLFAVLFVFQDSSSRKALDLLSDFGAGVSLCVALALDTVIGDSDHLYGRATTNQVEAGIDESPTSPSTPRTPRTPRDYNLQHASTATRSPDLTALRSEYDQAGAELFGVVRTLDQEVVMAGSERLCLRLRRPGGGRQTVECVCCGTVGGGDPSEDAGIFTDCAEVDDARAYGKPFYCVAVPYMGRWRLASERARKVDVALLVAAEGSASGDEVAVRITSREDSARLRAVHRGHGAFPVEGVERVRRHLTRCFRSSAVLLAAMGHTKLMSPAASQTLNALYGRVGGAHFLRQLRDGVAGALIDACAQLRRIARGAPGGDRCSAMRFHLAAAWQSLEGVTAVQVFLLSEMDRLMVTHCRKVLGRQPDGYDPEMCHAGPPKGVVCGENADSVSRAEEDADSEVTEKEPADAFKLAAWTALLRLIELSHSPAAHHRRVLRHRAFLALAGQLLLDLEGLAGAVEVLAEATP